VGADFDRAWENNETSFIRPAIDESNFMLSSPSEACKIHEKNQKIFLKFA
jgi:hypothetical protein